ncbi:CAP domain-containing protein [Halobacillus halophilus]|uniref:CAP domain-containing protein n=1 Tax=Halobacillus halophilus TaxID=1570 RepID=UPI001CD4A377|nr:CAP domain-containing protein [Halobacillus halophilus]MCA1010344.1 CAP domain-containing protein [Halobacillus halophilus]
MKGKSLILSGALVVSLLASPTTSLASSGDSEFYKFQQGNIHVEGVVNWVKQNEEALKNQSLQQVDIQSLLKQFQTQAPPEQKYEQPTEPVQEQPVKEETAEPKQQAPEAQPEKQDQASEQAAPQENAADQSDQSEVSAFERQVVELTNQERAKQGLAPLTLDTELSGVAGDKSLDMQKNDYFSHTSPTYGSPFDMMKDYGIDYRTAGENIAMGQTSPEQVVEGWMNSEGHRKNIMNPDFTHIGVGYVENGNYWTQMFIGK